MNTRDRGSVTVEALLLAPVLFVFTSFIVYVGRMTDAAITVRHAANTAARVASQSNFDDAFQRAVQSARQELDSTNSGCANSDVRVRRSANNAQNTFIVSVHCILDNRGMGVLGVYPLTISAESTEVVDVYTAR